MVTIIHHNGETYIQALTKNTEKLHKLACEFYESLGSNNPNKSTAKNQSTSPSSSGQPHVVDVFACSLDQVGLLEMKNLVEATGGIMVLGDSFAQSVLKESLLRVFNPLAPSHH